MIFPNGRGRQVYRHYGYSASYPADHLNEEIQNIELPLLNLPDGQYTAFAASLSTMMVQSYGVAIVKPAEGKTQEVWTQWMPISRTSSSRWSTISRISTRSLAAATVATVPHRRGGSGLL